MIVIGRLKRGEQWAVPNGKCSSVLCNKRIRRLKKGQCFIDNSIEYSKEGRALLYQLQIIQSYYLFNEILGIKKEGGVAALTLLQPILAL